jgi:predicted Zn-dependent peptidase
MTDKSSIAVTALSHQQTLIVDSSFQGQGASVAVLMKTGARDERQGESGISHFLEHMVFKGTPNRSGMDITLAFGDLGAQVNAYTSDEQTVFYGTVLNENADALHDLLLDMMTPALDPEEFDMEKKVILEEIALYQDRPNFVLYERAICDFFGGRGVGQSVLGTTETVSEITREQMASYVSRRYSAPNIIISMCGNLDADHYAQLTETRSGRLSMSAVEASPISSPTSSGSELVFHHKKNTQAHLLGLCRGPAANDNLRHAALLLGSIIGDSQNSRLYWKLVDTGIAEYAGIDAEDKDGVGCWMFGASTAPESWEEVRDKSAEVFRDAHSHISNAELERARTKALSRLVMDSELPLGRAMANALSYQYRNEIFSIPDEMERIRGVTLADCHAVLEQFPLTDQSLYVMLPE